MKRSSAIVVAVMAATLLFPAVAFGGGTAEDDEEVTLVMVPKGVHPYYEPAWEGFQDAADHYGVNAEYEAPADFDVSQQVRTLEDVISRGADGITISANDDTGLIGVVSDAVAQGIEVITFDAPAPSTEAATYIGTDNETAGAAGAEEMAERLGDSGQMAILQGGLGATNLNQRTQGFRERMEEIAPDIEVVTVEDYGGDRARAIDVTESLLETYPDLDGVFSVSADGAPAAAVVVEEQGVEDEIVVGGFDDLSDTLEAIENGTVDFAVVQRVYAMGWLSVERLLDLMEGEEIDSQYDTGVVIVTRDNYDTYSDEIMEEFAEED